MGMIRKRAEKGGLSGRSGRSGIAGSATQGPFPFSIVEVDHSGCGEHSSHSLPITPYILPILPTPHGTAVRGSGRKGSAAPLPPLSHCSWKMHLGIVIAWLQPGNSPLACCSQPKSTFHDGRYQAARYPICIIILRTRSQRRGTAHLARLPLRLSPSSVCASCRPGPCPLFRPTTTTVEYSTWD
jgi:hypothetical protein